MPDLDEWRFKAIERRMTILETEMKTALRDLAVLSGAAGSKQESKDDYKAVWGWVAAVAVGLFSAAVAWFKK